MKNKYAVSANRRMWLAIVWLMGVALAAQAQTSQPPVVQWQRVVEATSPIDVNGVNLTSPAVVKNSGGGYTVLTGDRRLLYLTSSENFITDTPITAVSVNGPTTALQVSGLTPTSDRGVVLGVKDNLDVWSLQKRDASGALVWVSRIAGNNANNSFYNLTDIVASSDGGFVVFGTNGDRRGTRSVVVSAEKFDRNGVQVWYRIIQYSFQRNTFTNQSIATPDGGYLLVGGTSAFPDRNAPRGWTAKLDGQGNIIQSQEYAAFPYALNGAIPNPDGSGSFIAVAINNVFIIQPSGDLIPTTTRPVFDSQAIIASDGSGQPYYVVLDKIAQNGGEFRLTGFNQQNQEVWTRTLGGSADDSPHALLTISDGYLLAGTTTSADGDIRGKQGSGLATWIVRLTKNAPPLMLTQPTYNCQTGTITFNTSGGDGSTITYNAPGISRSSATSNIGVVEQGLRNDPKPITITATQSGQTTNFTFDFGAFCNRPSRPLPPVVTRFIPDQTLTVGTEITVDNPARLDQYFMDPTQAGSAHYRSFLRFRANGLPPGLLSYDRSRELLPFGFFAGTPTTTGVYTVTVTATSENISPPDNSVSTTFKITIVDPTVVNPPTPPTGTGGTLALTQPTYNCQTGAITFNTSGGDGSTITYNAPGISRSSATSNIGVVEQGLRNDPKPITITATQNGQTVSYAFDFRAYCADPRRTRIPLPSYIPNPTFTVNQSLSYPDLVIGSGYYNASDPYNYRTWPISASGLPPGLGLYTGVVSGTYFYIGIFGIPTTPGAYPVTVTAIDPRFPNDLPFTVSFTITILGVGQPPVVNPPTGNALTLLAPTYDCGSGAITFRSSGGDGSPIEYAAAGITGWTTNPNQFVDRDSRTANDVQPFMLMARQNGLTTTYVWDLKVACGRARQGVAERVAELSVSVLGNPVSEAVTVEVRGAEGQPLSLRLLDSRGRLVESRTVEQAGSVERQRFALPPSGPSLLLLRVSSGTRSQTVKILRQ